MNIDDPLQHEIDLLLKINKKINNKKSFRLYLNNQNELKKECLTISENERLYNEFEKEIKHVILKFFKEILKNHPNETFYSFSIFCDNNISSFYPTLNTFEGLDRLLKKYGDLEDIELKRKIKWSVDKWTESYSKNYKKYFNKANSLCYKLYNITKNITADKFWEEKEIRLIMIGKALKNFSTRFLCDLPNNVDKNYLVLLNIQKPSQNEKDFLLKINKKINNKHSFDLYLSYII